MEANAWKWLTSFTGFGGQRMEAFGFPQLLAVLGVSLACATFNMVFLGGILLIVILALSGRLRYNLFFRRSPCL